MADDMEKTEAATPRRRQEAYEQGRVPKSPEVMTATLLLGAALTVQALAPLLGRTVRDVFGSGLYLAGAGVQGPHDAVAMFSAVAWRVLAALVAMLAATYGIVAFVGAAQARGILSSKAITPSFKKLDPLANARRMVGTQPWVELLRSLVKLGLIGGAVYVALGAAWDDILALAQSSPQALVEVIRHYAVRLLLIAGLAYLGLALVDYLYQVWSFEKSIRMSKEEIKQEAKQSEGDANTKARIRSFGRSLIRRKMFRDVPKADVVIANPTHIAIALRYDPDTAPAPYVLAMGERKVAERIKRLAFEHDVPVIENRPLARALLASAQVGMIIPAELYAAVAEILAFVYRQRAAAPRRWSGARG